MKVRVEDITFANGIIRIFMRRNKTDTLNEGSVCTVVEKGRAFNVRGFLEAYLKIGYQCYSIKFVDLI